MAKLNSNDRSPRDLSVPETMKIAALLAELMPPGAEIGSGAEPIRISSGASDSAHDGQGSVLEAPVLEMQELDVPARAEIDDTAVTKPIQSFVEPDAATKTPVALTESALARAKALESALIRVKAIESMPAPAKVVESTPTPAKPVVSMPAPANTVEMTPTSLDPELIPLGSLSVAGYFSIVNWKNDPRRVRHPRRADYGLDQQTLAQASRNPFYVVGQPRRPEDRSVSEVLAEIVWE
jgi:hypothetical protein